MIAELRFYTITPGHEDALLRQFEDTSVPLFARHGITSHGPWLRSLTKGSQLVYVVEFDDEADRDRKWAAFRADPDWRAARRVPGADDHVAGNETLELQR